MLRWTKSAKPEGVANPSASAPPRPAVEARPGPPVQPDGLPSRRSLAEVLLEAGKVGREPLDRALKVQAETGEFLGEILVREGILDERSLTSFLAKYCKIPHLSLLDYLIDQEVVRILPREVCLQYRVLPIDKLGQNLTVAMVNPLNAEALDKVRELCPDLRIKPILCAYQHFVMVTQRLFQGKESGGPIELTASSLGLCIERTAPGSAAEVSASVAAPTTVPPVETVEEEIPEAVEILAEAAERPFDHDAVIAGAFPAGAAPPAVEAASEPVLPPQPEAVPEEATGIMQELASVMMDSMRDTYSMLARRVDLFRGVAPEDVATIFARGMTEEYEAGHVLFRKGDPGDKLYIILGGSVEVFDEDRVIAVLSRGEMVGEMALLSKAPRSAGVRVRETTSLLALSDEIIWSVMPREVSMRLLINIVATLSDRLRRANQR